MSRRIDVLLCIDFAIRRAGPFWRGLLFPLRGAAAAYSRPCERLGQYHRPAEPEGRTSSHRFDR